MQLILIRHGIAADPSTGQSDDQRRLTDLGIKRTRRAMQGLAKLIDRPQIILTSPKRRAVETANIAATALVAPVQSVDWLAAGPAEQVIDHLAERTEQRIVLVGHEPTCSQLVEILCFGRSESAVRLKKASAACIECPAKLQAGYGELLWLATPRMLRKIA